MATAQGIISVVTANMARAIRVISVQRGHDPRDYTLMAFGGAGPLHAARLARELDIGRVLVPRNPGILCALGLLLTDLRADFAATRLMPRDRGVARRHGRGASPRWPSGRALVRRRRASPPTTGASRAPSTCATHGQNYELAVAGARRADHAGDAATRWRRASPTRTSQTYGFVADGEPVQLVTFRVEATGMVRKAELRAASRSRPGRRRRHRRAPRRLAAGGAATSSTCPSTTATRLRPGNRFAGPAIVEQMDATTLCCRA